LLRRVFMLTRGAGGAIPSPVMAAQEKSIV
jgi:hypothetical protein